MPELKNELTNRGIIYDNKNKRQETLANTEGNIWHGIFKCYEIYEIL